MSRPVFFFTRMLPGYRVPVLEKLNSVLDKRLIVGHGQPPKGSSLETLLPTSEPSFERVKLPNYWFRGQTLHAQPYRRLFRAYERPSAVLAEESPRSLTLPWLLRHARRQGAARILWGHFSSNRRSFSPWHPLDRYRLEMARRMEACVCYSDPIKQTLARHLQTDKLFVARNTVQTDKLFSLYSQLANEGKSAVRQRLDLPVDRPVLLFLGRLIPKKGTDMLLKVFEQVRQQQPASLLVIGDGPERLTLKQRVRKRNIPDVQFLGAVTKAERLAPYLYSADLMFIPGYLGLAVNDAFVFGLPVVSQQAPAGRRFHSPEVAYVEHGVNGMLTPWNDQQALVEGVLHVLDHLEPFSRAACSYAQEHLTMDRMVKGLTDAIAFATQQV